jgi:hypothetical protein
MSLAQNYIDRWLKADIEDYLRGHEPRPVELKRAPLLENWRIVLLSQLTDRPPLAYLAGQISMVGNVTNHPAHDDGELIRTAGLAWLDRYWRWARAKDRLYGLGERSAQPFGGNVRVG